MSNYNTSNNVTVQSPIIGLLGVVFVTLKLCGVITWSWLWVTLPFWGGAALILVFLVIALIAGIIAALFGSKSKKNDKPSLRAI